MKCFLVTFLAIFMGTAQIPIDDLTGKSNNTGNVLLADADRAFLKMKEAAAREGIKLSIVSGYRSFDRQQLIWNRKYKRYAAQGLEPEAIFDKIVEYSTVPGTSRHHWGTDIDVIDTAAHYKGDVLVPEKFHGTGPFCKMKEWMEVHAAEFGFELVYTLDASRKGFKYEPWHYSYVPLSRKRYKEYLSSIDLVSWLRKEGVMGMEKISDERLNRYVEEHIKGINNALK